MPRATLPDFLKMLPADIDGWCRGRRWQLRGVMIAWFVYVLVKYLHDPFYTSIMSGLNLGIHELGHFVFSFLGKFMGVLGGTLLQCLVPVYAIAHFYRQGDFFAIAFAFAWQGISLFDVARYVADARAQVLPLVSPFGSSCIHDWNYLLTRMGLLEYDTALAALVRLGACVSMLAAISFGGWLVWKMIITHDIHNEPI